MLAGDAPQPELVGMELAGLKQKFHHGDGGLGGGPMPVAETKPLMVLTPAGTIQCAGPPGRKSVALGVPSGHTAVLLDGRNLLDFLGEFFYMRLGK